MKRRIAVAVLLIVSALLTCFQLIGENQEETEFAVSIISDIKAGERITTAHLGMIPMPSKYLVENRPRSVEEAAGRYARVDIAGGTLVTDAFLSADDPYKIQRGRALTAIRLLPDSAICWITEIGQAVDVYFVDDLGKSAILGEVVVKKNFDPRMNEEDTLQYVVVEGDEAVVRKIVEKRAVGRLEIVKKK